MNVCMRRARTGDLMREATNTLDVLGQYRLDRRGSPTLHGQRRRAPTVVAVSVGRTNSDWRELTSSSDLRQEAPWLA